MVEHKHSVIIKIKLDQDLFDQLKKEATKHETDVPTYMRWCAQTGLYLEDLTAFISQKVKSKN